MKDFIYSVYITKQAADATALELKYGINEEEFWLVKIDIEGQKIEIGNETTSSIKSTYYPFTDNREYKLNVVVNNSVTKVYIDDSDVALLVMDIEGYIGGDVTDNLAKSHLTYARRNATSLNTLSGDIFVSGYEVNKVINLSDNNYKLAEDEYTVDAGVVTINPSYLNTLENNTDYKFRAVTSLTDFDFYVTTKEVGVQVTSLVEKSYYGDDVKFELSENVTVNQLFIDNTEYKFEQKNELVTVKSENLESLPSGDHIAKLYTENGRPEAKFSFYVQTEVIPKIPEPVSHVFFFIDIGIFAALIAGYIAFTVIKKRNNRRV